jgi:glutamate racemase
MCDNSSDMIELKNRPIGIFDSGLGGLTALKELEKLMPNENIVYFGDTGRVPYGTRSRDTILHYAAQDMRFLQIKNVKAILAACGTVSSVAGDIGKQQPVPYLDVIEATAAAAVKTTKTGRIGVIGTNATILSGSYRKEILKQLPNAVIVEQPCPLFVPIVENGFVSAQDALTRLVVERHLSVFNENPVDTLILGCTHFPIISETISDVMGADVALINSGKEAAIMLSKQLKAQGLLRNEITLPEKQYFVSDTADNFSCIAEIFLGHSIAGTVEQIRIEDY